MTKRVLIFLAIIFSSLLIKAQDVAGLSFGFEAGRQKEPYLYMYDKLPIKLSNEVRNIFYPSLGLHFKSNYGIGFIFGTSDLKVDKTSGIWTQNYSSKMTSLCVYYNFKIFESKRFFATAVPEFGLTQMEQRLNATNTDTLPNIQQGFDISSVYLNMKIKVGYEILNNLDIYLFLADKLIARDVVKYVYIEKVSVNRWDILDDKPILGLGIKYRLMFYEKKGRRRR